MSSTAETKLVTFTDAEFSQQIANGSKPVLVDFWAEWCGPCRMLTPVVDELAEEFDGKAVVGKLNVDQNPKSAAEYGISSIPSIFVFKDGEVVEKVVGVRPKDFYVDLLNQHAS